MVQKGAPMYELQFQLTNRNRRMWGRRY